MNLNSICSALHGKHEHRGPVYQFFNSNSHFGEILCHKKIGALSGTFQVERYTVKRGNAKRIHFDAVCIRNVTACYFNQQLWWKNYVDLCTIKVTGYLFRSI